MNKVFTAFWYSGILPLLSCTTTTTTTTSENHESLSRPQSAKKEGTKAKQNREKDLEKKDKKKGLPQIKWLKDQWRSVADKSSACYKNGGMRQSSSFSLPITLERFVGVEGESAQRCKARLERHRKTTERAAKRMKPKTSMEARLRAECAAVERATKLNRLNTAVEETTKVVQELKTEFSRRKSSRNLQVSSSKTEISTSPYKTRGKHTEPIPQSSTENRDNVQDSGVFVTEEGECASSVLTEEPQQEVLEMDRLEAELESELQKIPWCSTEASGFERKTSDICELNTDIHVQDYGFFVTEEGECASSVLTEEPQQEVLEMDRLEAELEFELQKIPWCSTEASRFEGKISDICEFNTDIHVQDSGVFVTEEGERASSVLIEEPQQEVLEMDRLEAELESELQKLPWCSTEASGFEGKISDICEFNTDIHVQDSGVFVTEEGECASSVLTEEPQQEVLEMDRLEAELESELQKLPWCSTEASGFEGKISDICEFNTDIHVQDSGVFVKVERKCGGFDQSKSGKKFSVCLKKRRTSKNSPRKCESCSSKDNSTFSWGLGVGIMCMMFAGKAEISRLNTAVDETTKVVQELKTEFSRRKSSRNLQVSSSKTEISTSPYKTRGKHTEPIPQSSTENRDNVQDSGVFVTEEGECESSVLTEEPQQEVLEMDRLEAELESELQKLTWCSTEASGFEGKISDICENEDASFEVWGPEKYRYKLIRPNPHKAHNGSSPNKYHTPLLYIKGRHPK